MRRIAFARQGSKQEARAKKKYANSNFPSSRTFPPPRAEGVADAGIDSTITACAIQSAPRSACDEALPLTRCRIAAQDSKIVRPVGPLTSLSAHWGG